MSTLAMKVFLGAPIKLDPPLLSSKRLTAFAMRLLVFTGILLIAALSWSGLAWLVDYTASVLVSYQAVYVEGMDPVLPEYYAGWGR